MSYKAVENILQTYTLEEILALNELTEEDALYYMVETSFVTLPTPAPVDLEDD